MRYDWTRGRRNLTDDIATESGNRVSVGTITIYIFFLWWRWWWHRSGWSHACSGWFGREHDTGVQWSPQFIRFKCYEGTVAIRRWNYQSQTIIGPVKNKNKWAENNEISQGLFREHLETTNRHHLYLVKVSSRGEGGGGGHREAAPCPSCPISSHQAAQLQLPSLA